MDKTQAVQRNAALAVREQNVEKEQKRIQDISNQQDARSVLSCKSSMMG